MPEFMCVQCFSCETYQVQQVKKANKFQCSLCGEKQTVQRVFAVSHKAKDIRLVVQNKNIMRCRAEEPSPPQRSGNAEENVSRDDFHSEEACRLVNWDEFTSEAHECSTVVDKENGSAGAAEENYVTLLPERKRKEAPRRANSCPKKRTTASRPFVGQKQRSESESSRSVPRKAAAAEAEERCADGRSPSRKTTTGNFNVDSATKSEVKSTKGGSMWASFLEDDQNAACNEEKAEIGSESKWGAFLEEDKETKPSGGSWGGDASQFATAFD